MSWETVSSITAWEDSHLKVSIDTVATPSRSTPRRWTIAHRKPAVVIAPMTGERRIVLIRQERIAIRETIWEVPAGQVDELCSDGSFKDVALREMREETGYELCDGGELTPLGHFYSSAGFTNERAFLFVASPVRRSARGAAHTDSEAIVDCREFSPAELRRMVAANEICDANTLTIFARLVAAGLI